MKMGNEGIWVVVLAATYHAMTLVLGVGLKDTVCGGVISCCVHGIRASLIQRCGEAHIAGCPACYCDFGHGGSV